MLAEPRTQKLAQSSPRHCGCQGHCRGAEEEEEEEEAQEDSGGDCWLGRVAVGNVDILTSLVKNLSILSVWGVITEKSYYNTKSKPISLLICAWPIHFCIAIWEICFKFYGTNHQNDEKHNGKTENSILMSLSPIKTQVSTLSKVVVFFQNICAGLQENWEGPCFQSYWGAQTRLGRRSIKTLYKLPKNQSHPNSENKNKTRNFTVDCIIFSSWKHIWNCRFLEAFWTLLQNSTKIVILTNKVRF